MFEGTVRWSLNNRFLVIVLWLLAVVLGVVAWPLTGLFTDNDAIHNVAVIYLWIMAISYGGYGMVMTTCAAFNGMGYPLPGVVMSFKVVVAALEPDATVGAVNEALAEHGAELVEIATR